MKIFKELKKLGYKHYTEHTVEELDNLPLESKERIMEQALVLRFFREKYNLGHMINGIGYESFLMNIGGIITVFPMFKPMKKQNLLVLEN